MESIYCAGLVWKRKFERNLQDHGWKTVLRKSLGQSVSLFYRHTNYRLYKIDLSKQSTEAPTALEGVEFRFIHPTDDAAIQQIEDTSEWLAGSLKQRLSAGAICLVAFSGDRLGGFNLVSFGQVFMPLVQLSKVFQPDQAWSEQISTVKTLRHKGLASQLRYRIFEELRRRGIRKFYGGALADNLPSLKLARRVGFNEFVEIRYTRILQFNQRRYLRTREDARD